MSYQLLILALGSNLGQRDFYLKTAIEKLSGRVGKWLANSLIYETVAIGVDPNHGDYLNMVVAFSSSLFPAELLAITQDIEKEFGRETKGDLKPRTLDIDIIWYGTPVKTQNLEIPHPRFLEREFVWRPMLDVIPDFLKEKSDSKVMNSGKSETGIRRIGCF